MTHFRVKGKQIISSNLFANSILVTNKLVHSDKADRTALDSRVDSRSNELHNRKETTFYFIHQFTEKNVAQRIAIS